MLGALRNAVFLQIRKYAHRTYIRASLDAVTNNSNRRQIEDSPIDPNRSYGQPTAVTHPHLIGRGEVVAGIQLSEFKQRRNKLMESIIAHASAANLGKSHIVVIPSSSKVYMSDKIPYVFRQNTEFLYFTGCQEPDSVLVLTAKHEKIVSTLFMRKKDEHSELWDGPRTGVDTAPLMFAVDAALPVSEFQQFFISFINENKKAVVWYESIDAAQPAFHATFRQLIDSPNAPMLLSPTSIMHKIRLIKSQAEISLMQKSCEIISAAISKTIETSKPNMSEHHIFATVDYQCRMNGAEFLAYPPVVASGKNANVIHYIANNQIVREGDMVLMDAGCEYHGYSSDVTRTWPINGTFTQQQKVLYDTVLDVQKTLITKLKDFPSLDQLYYDMCSLLGKRLQEIGLIPKHFGKTQLLSAVYAFCPHHVSHYLGMDVHDTGKLSRNFALKPGVIVTVEPGIYISDKNQFAPPEFHGLGVRIEDDILLTEDGPVNLTRNCPKEIHDIESLTT